MKTSVEEELTELFRVERVEDIFARFFDALPPGTEADTMPLLHARLAADWDELRALRGGADRPSLYDQAIANGPIAPLLLISVDPMGDDPIHELSVLPCFGLVGSLRNRRRR